MVRHLADWVAPFPPNEHSPPSPLKFLHAPSSPPPFTSPYVHEKLGAITIIIMTDYFLIMMKIMKCECLYCPLEEVG